MALSIASRRPVVNRHPALWSPDFPPRTCVRGDCLASFGIESITGAPGLFSEIQSFPSQNGGYAWLRALLLCLILATRYRRCITAMFYQARMEGTMKYHDLILILREALIYSHHWAVN